MRTFAKAILSGTLRVPRGTAMEFEVLTPTSEGESAICVLPRWLSAPAKKTPSS
jgi:hypothetical protein